MKHLHLERPIVFIDLETTGTNPTNDRIVEVTVLKINQDGSEKLISTLINPEIPIPPDATKIHGITNEDVAGKPQFKQYAKGINEFLLDCDLCGYNIKKFDLPMLEAEFQRAGILFSRDNIAVLDPMVIFHKHEPRDLEAAYRKYCGKQLLHGHRSEVDVRATIEIFEAQLENYQEMSRSVKDLHTYCCIDGEDRWVDNQGKLIWLNDEATFNFGKHKGESLQNIVSSAPDYLQWLLGKDFPNDFLTIIREALQGNIPIPSKPEHSSLGQI
jgi:DNA polymerase-3 subunit epsilon